MITICIHWQVTEELAVWPNVLACIDIREHKLHSVRSRMNNCEVDSGGLIWRCYC